MENLQLKEGDNFIRKSKYGLVIGIVDKIIPTYVTDYSNYISYINLTIKSTKGVIYDMNECYKIDSFLDKEKCDKMAKVLKHMHGKKLELHKQYGNI